MNNEMEIQCDSPEIPIKMKQPKKGETMNNEVEIQCGSPEIPIKMKQPKKGETMNNEVEIQCDSLEIPINVEPKKGEIMNDEVEIQSGSSEIPMNVELKKGETMNNNEVGNDGGSTESARIVKPKKGWKVLLEKVWSWLAHKDKDEWLKDMRGNLSLVATVIATMTFQMALDPPGGVMPVIDNLHNTNLRACKPILPSYIGDNDSLCPGYSVLAFTSSNDYDKFVRWNTTCFVASLSVLLFLVSGISLNHRFPMWILSIGMCLTLTSLANTYITAVQMTTPDPLWKPTKDFQKGCINAWIVLMSLLAFLLTLRLIIWVFYIRKSKILANTPNNARENIPPA